MKEQALAGFENLGYPTKLIRNLPKFLKEGASLRTSFGDFGPITVDRECDGCGTKRGFFPLAGTDRKGPCEVCGRETMWRVVEVKGVEV